MILYLLPATLVFAIALHTLLQNADASRTDVETWVCFVIAALLWPLTLPAILYKKCSTALVGSMNLLPAQPKGTAVLEI